VSGGGAELRVDGVDGRLLSGHLLGELGFGLGEKGGYCCGS
jgi:hypothetical protein